MNLIIQSPSSIAEEAIAHLVQLSGATSSQRVSDTVYRLPGARNNEQAVADYCAQARLDFGYVEAGRRLADFGLVVMDMDSTLITIECIDEIADMLGIRTQVAEVTAAAMRGEIEFAESLRRRVALLAGLDQSALQRVYDERLRFSPGAETMLAALRRHNVKTLLVSGGFTFFTDRLKTRLQLDYTASNTLEIVDGKLTGKVLGKIVDAQGKADWLQRVRDELGLRREQVIAIGDGANDLKMLAEAGTSIAYHAKPVVRAVTTYAFNYVGLDGLIGLYE
ncbi:MAG: phosphoserine phosphatase SerB [Pseudomonadota bacterium]